MAKLMVSMPKAMITKIERLAKRESRSKSELLREAVRYYEIREQKQGMTLEEAKKLSRETDKVARELGRSVGSWDAVTAIRHLRDSR